MIVRGAPTAHQVMDPADDVRRMLQHDTMVGRQIRFAFGAIDQQRVDLFAVRDSDLGVGRESGSTKPHNPSQLNRLDDLFGSVGVGDRRVPLHHLLRGGGKRFQKERRRHLSVDARRRSDATDLAAGGRMNRDRHEPIGIGDPLASRHLGTLTHQRDGRFADVLGEGHNQQRCEGELANRQPAGVVFVFRGMDAVLERLAAQWDHQTWLTGCTFQRGRSTCRCPFRSDPEATPGG